MSHPYQPSHQRLGESRSVKPVEFQSDPGIDINWVLYSPSDPFDCVIVTSMKNHHISLPLGHLRSFFKILLRREAQRVMEPERIRFWKPNSKLSIFNVSQGWTRNLTNLSDVATELPLPAKFRLVIPEKSAVDDGSGNVHLIITINPEMKIIEEDNAEGAEAAVPPELFANPPYKQSLIPSAEGPWPDVAEPQATTSHQASVSQPVDTDITVNPPLESTADVRMDITMSTNADDVSGETTSTASGSQGENLESAGQGNKTKNGYKGKFEKNRVKAGQNGLRTTSMQTSPPHNQKEMDLEKARLINEVNNWENKVVFLNSEETFLGLNGGPPPCRLCKELVKGLPVTGTLAFEKINFAGFKAFRIAPNETTYDADERNEKTLKDRVVRRSNYYHWSCLKNTHKRHYVDTPPIRHSSVDSQNWEKVLSDIKASVGGGKPLGGGKKGAQAVTIGKWK